MSTQEIPPLAERIFDRCADKLVDWIGEQGPFISAMVFTVIWVTWKMRQLCKERPAWHFFIDLSIDTLLLIAFSWSIEMFTSEIAVPGAERRGFVSTVVGHWVTMGIEALHFVPLLLLFLHQSLKLCQLLRQKW